MSPKTPNIQREECRPPYKAGVGLRRGWFLSVVLALFGGGVALSGCQSAAPVYAPLPGPNTNPPIQMPAAVSRSTADVVPVPQITLAWDYDPSILSLVGFTVETSVDLVNWSPIGDTTNLTYSAPKTNTWAFFRVGAHWLIPQ